MDAEGKATYAPPHAVDFHVIMIGLKKLNVKAVCAIGSTGSLRPDEVINVKKEKKINVRAVCAIGSMGSR
jgi:purine nucleoside phosphorylase